MQQRQLFHHYWKVRNRHPELEIAEWNANESDGNPYVDGYDGDPRIDTGIEQSV